MIALFFVILFLTLLVFFVTRSLPVKKRLGYATATFIVLSAVATMIVLRAVENTYDQPDQHPYPVQTEK